MLALWPLAGTGAVLDDALALVSRSHPPLTAQDKTVVETAHQRSWTSAVTFGWTESGTEYGGAAGINAGIAVRIPIFDRSQKLRVAQAQTEAARSRDAVLTAFLGEVRSLKELADKVAETDDLRKLHRDRVEYWRKAVQQGKAEQERLWPEAEQWRRAEHAYRQARGNLETTVETTARRFGGEEWSRLRDLLVEIAK